MIEPEEDAYFIKAGYRPNLIQNTFDHDDSDAYWTEERIGISERYQFDVYSDAVSQLTDSSRLLDIGCGPPRKLSQLLADKPPEIWLVDQPSTSALAKRLLPSAKFVPANLEKIDTDLGVRFDVIICADVIEHLVNPDRCLAFIGRHLSEAGVAYISTPERDLLRGYGCMHCPHPMHVREWNKEEFATLLMARGFQIERQYIVPQQKVLPWKKAFGRMAHLTGIRLAWYSCQVAICRTGKFQCCRE